MLNYTSTIYTLHTYNIYLRGVANKKFRVSIDPLFIFLNRKWSLKGWICHVENKINYIF